MGVPSTFGTVAAATDVTFGTWNATTSSFTALAAGNAAMPAAARVVTDRAGDNPVGSFLFRIIGVRQMDVRPAAVYTTYYDQCETDGLMAQGIVDIESMNAFFRGFCVHSNTYVSASQNNSFELGTIVSMPDKTQLDIPHSGFEQNAGLEQALRNATYDLSELNRLHPAPFVQSPGVENYYTALSKPYNVQTAPFSPKYITSSEAMPHPPGTYTADDFTEGRVHTINTCTTSGSGSTLTLRAGTRPYRNVVIFTNCNIQFDGDVLMTNAVVSTTSTDDKSIKTPSGNQNGLQLGVDDDCADGGGAQLLTRGGMDAAAKLTFYGGQIRALGDVQFAAQVEGEGVSVMTMGRVLGSSRGELYGCGGTGMDHDFQPTRFRLAS